MSYDTVLSRPRRSARTSPRSVLNAGSGSNSARQIPDLFRSGNWQETRIDLDPEARPDVVGSITDMAAVFPGGSFDAVWSSHVLEHLFAHQVADALGEFHRILKPDGFVVITLPDLEAIAAAIVENGVDHVLYVSPAGPITPLDVLYGHSASIARGMGSMAHHTGFSCTRLGECLADAGFASVLATRSRYDLWALGLRERADQAAIEAQLLAAGLDMFKGSHFSGDGSGG